MKYLVFLLALLFALPATAKVRIQDTPEGPIRVGTSFDGEIALGRGKITPQGVWANDLRLRLGGLYFLEPWIAQAGITAEVCEHLPLSLGVQGGILHLYTGLWGELGGFIDGRSGKPGYSAGVGWSLVGIEYQNRMRSKRNIQVIMGRIRLPFGIVSLRWQ